MKIGRHRITFGSITWTQTHATVTTRRFLCLWIFKVAKLQDSDKRRQFPLGTQITYKGKRYHYYKMGG